MPVIRNLRWWIAGLLALATALNYLDRQSFPVVVGEIKKTIPISNEQYGQLTSLFLLAYAIMYAGGGRIMDWLGTRRLRGDDRLVVDRQFLHRPGLVGNGHRRFSLPPWHGRRRRIPGIRQSGRGMVSTEGARDGFRHLQHGLGRRRGGRASVDGIHRALAGLALGVFHHRQH